MATKYSEDHIQETCHRAHPKMGRDRNTGSLILGGVALVDARNRAGHAAPVPGNTTIYLKNTGTTEETTLEVGSR